MDHPTSDKPNARHGHAVHIHPHEIDLRAQGMYEEENPGKRVTDLPYAERYRWQMKASHALREEKSQRQRGRGLRE